MRSALTTASKRTLQVRGVKTVVSTAICTRTKQREDLSNTAFGPVVETEMEMQVQAHLPQCVGISESDEIWGWRKRLPPIVISGN